VNEEKLSGLLENGPDIKPGPFFQGIFFTG
jgi:hypothetical protein